MNNFARIVSLAFFWIVFANSAVVADSLTDVENSKLLQKKLSGSKLSRDLHSQRWLSSRSQFSRLFLEERGPLLLFEWLELGSRIKEATFTKTKSSILAFLKINDRHTLGVLVPHPKFLVTRNMALLDEFVALEPPEGQLVAKSEIQIKGRTWKRSRTDKNVCLITLDLPKGSLLYFRENNCQDLEGLTSTALQNAPALEKLELRLQQ